MTTDHTWTCIECGKQHSGLPLDFAYPAPDYWIGIPEVEREKRGKIDSDVCIVDDAIFIRGCLEIPVPEINNTFVWGVWVSVSEESFSRILEFWSAPKVENEPPRFGWLANDLSPYPTTLNLKTHVHLRGDGLRPTIELEPTQHPLALEQRTGISLKRVEELAAMLLHRH